MNSDKFQTQVRGSNQEEYQIYLANCLDENGLDVTSGEPGFRQPPKSYQEWLDS